VEEKKRGNFHAKTGLQMKMPTAENINSTVGFRGPQTRV
jgi:hypothetical protein